MNKKRWFLLVLMLAAGYLSFRLFYKSYSTSVVSADADAIVSVDTKRIFNTILWQTITSPRKWKPGNIFKKSATDSGWNKMISIPDYVFVFHVKGQPLNAWYVVLDIKDEDGFGSGLNKYQFTNIGKNKWRSELYPVAIYRSGKKLLLATNAPGLEQFADTTAARLFLQHSFIDAATLNFVTGASSHLAVFIRKNEWLQADALLTADYAEKKIKIAGDLILQSAFQFKQQRFSNSESSLLSFGISQPPAALYSKWDTTSKRRIEKAMSLAPDAIFLASNKSYSLELPKLVQRIDTAISYEYDEDFNQKEKVVLNPVTEPALEILIKGDSISSLQTYFDQAKKTELTAAGIIFNGIPFVKTFVQATDSSLSIKSANYPVMQTNKDFEAVFFLRLNAANIPEAINNYFPRELKKLVQSLNLISLLAMQNKSALEIKGEMNLR